ncbi:MAG TPA: hydantoinase/carbamoylase family amidase [Solirubrobacteraceae bacterium]|nr:hydantoinase/carbamoylase family amidase [Solirubrobacteraceae bacterium]
MTVAAEDLATLLESLTPIGQGPRGTSRLAWSPEAAAAEDWFHEQADAVGLRFERDPAGNLWACPVGSPPWWAVGSRLDSVREGGRFDGALGVAAGFAVVADGGRRTAVVSFADEEGARFNTPTFGSRALTGRLDVEDALARVDDDGVTLADALASAGIDPGGLTRAPEWLERLRGLLELHIDQSRTVADSGHPAASVGRLVSRMRVRGRIKGRADHAGTTLGGDRRDALAAAARLIAAAEDAASPRSGMVATAARIHVAPNAATTVPALAVVWLDARASEHADVIGWRAELESTAAVLARERGVEIALATEAESRGTVFDPGVRAALGRAGAGGEVLCYAGHDAGVVAGQRPAGMVLVRNRSGISHAPEEEIDLADAAAGAAILARALEELA